MTEITLTRRDTELPIQVIVETIELYEANPLSALRPTIINFISGTKTEVRETPEQVRAKIDAVMVTIEQVRDEIASLRTVFVAAGEAIVAAILKSEPGKGE